MGAILLWLWQRPADRSGATAEISPSSPAPARDDARDPLPRAIVLRTRLLPDAGISAQPASVRVGVAEVPAGELAAHRAWLRGGAQGAGAGGIDELAAVERWIEAQAALDASGTVVVGPVELPPARRYVLQARADDRMRFYEAWFDAGDPPAEVRPMLAAGLRVRAPRDLPAGAGLLLRRVEGGGDAAWQGLMRREAPEVLSAYDEQALPLGRDTTIAPLPPGPLDIVTVIGGVESERRSLNLSPGRVHTLDLDSEISHLSAALTANVELRLIEAGVRAPVAGAKVVWSSARGERSARSDAAGLVRIGEVDVSQPLPIEIGFERPSVDGGDIDALPRWPERIAETLRFDDRPIPPETNARTVPRTIVRTIELTPLRWLIVDAPGIDTGMRPRIGEPYPVFSLQRLRDNRWQDATADHFIPVREGLAVSLDGPGSVRVVAALAPWNLRYSEAVTVPASADRNIGRAYRTRIAATAGRRLLLRMRAAGRPLSSAPVHLLAPTRGMPPKVVTADASGRVLLDGVTVPKLIVEVPGYAQTEVAATAAVVDIALSRD
ncbi:MAG: hypothetical protein E6Q88_05055 [Lysobacteraceae bacterium]|nr:MAG: hypothetical protein E6Q88_05055 [Xanthomonadaceae bacterium]